MTPSKNIPLSTTNRKFKTTFAELLTFEEQYINHQVSMKLSSPNVCRFCAHRILADTLAEERQRQRKKSRKLARNRSNESVMQVCYTGPQGLVELLGREEQDYLGLERIRRAEPHPELTQDFDLSESDYSSYKTRDRSRRYVSMAPENGVLFDNSAL